MKNYILDADTANRKLERIAYQILEENESESEIILAGIRMSGSVVARNIQQILSRICSIPTKLITVTLDKRNPTDIALSESLDYNDKVIILIDDVANSGKTLLYAMKPFLEFHPKKIQTLVLVERTHKSFPIHNDYVGLSVATTVQEHIFVEVEGEKVGGAYLE